MNAASAEPSSAGRQVAAGVLAGGLLCLGVVATLSVGLPFFVLGLGMAVWIGFSRRLRGWAAVRGLVAGVALVLLFMGVLHLGDHPCPGSSGVVTLAPGQSESGCGGLNPVPWLAVGGGLGVLSLLGLRLTLRR